MALAAGLGSVGGVVPPPAARLALRAWAHAPTTTPERLAVVVLVKVVFAE
jgi:hypothetical protein